MNIIYLHDPKAGASVLPQLEETFPMLEIVAIDLEDDFEKQFEALKALFSQINYRNYYAIVADGFGIAYASFFRNTWTKGLTHPNITILLNPDYRAIKNCETYKKMPKVDYFGDEVDWLNHLFGNISIFTYENYHLLLYHQQHYGGNYLLLSQSTAFMSIKDLIDKSAKDRVTINYLKIPILTPQGQILPPDYPLISVNGCFDWFGEKLFNARIPSSAFQFRDGCVVDASTLYLLSGDIIEPYPNENCNFYRYLANGDFKNLATGEIIKGQRAPFNFNPFGYSLPDWQVRWLFKELVKYKIYIPFNELKNETIGFDKYGHKFIIKAIDYEAQFLWEDNIEKGAIQQRDKRCDNYVAGVFPKSDTPDKIFLLPYNYEGIMAFKSSGKRISGYPIAEILKRKREEAKVDTHKNDSTGNE